MENQMKKSMLFVMTVFIFFSVILSGEEKSEEPEKKDTSETSEEQATEPAEELQPQPVAETAPQPVAEPAPQPVAEPAPQPVAEPAPQPVAEPAPQPVAKTAAQPAEEKPATISDALKAGNISVGGYGALSMKFTGFDQNDGFLSENTFFAYMIGARGGILLDHKWTIGAGFYVLANKFHYRCPAGDTTDFCTDDPWLNKMILGYGGLYFSYLAEIKKFMGIDLGFLAGGGSMKGKKSEDDDHWYNDEYGAEYSFFIFEPEIQLVAKFTDYFGMAIGIGYRLTVPDSKSAYSIMDMSGPFISMEARLGVF
jgi:hypothetical protein